MAKTMAATSKAAVKTKQNAPKEILEETLRHLNENRSTTAAAVVARRDEPSDYGDMSEQSHEETLFVNRNKATTEQLRSINEALERINAGTYGICAECEKPISPKRLQAVPWAKYCITCQEQRGSWTN
jgi:DnaK suppressor protein